MANEEQLKIINKSVDAWNEWRSLNKHIKIDLSEADLSRTNLKGAYLSEVNLRGANLSEADLSEADLSEADLRGTNLSSANLSLANLSLTDLNSADLSCARLNWANFIDTDLRDANLTKASLYATRFSWSIMNNTEVNGAQLAFTTFTFIDLSDTKNLNKCEHSAQSSIDTYTLLKSKNIPREFLVGCGLPDHFIEYINSFKPEVFQYYSCFISYSNDDKVFADRLYADLQKDGIRCWFAPEDMKTGEKIRSSIDEAIKIYDKLLLILSKNSIESQWVEKEVETAFEKESRREGKPVLFPIRLDNAVMETTQAWAADIRRTRHIGDFRNWKNYDEYRKSFERLKRDLAGKN